MVLADETNVFKIESANISCARADRSFIYIQVARIYVNPSFRNNNCNNRCRKPSIYPLLSFTLPFPTNQSYTIKEHSYQRLKSDQALISSLSFNRNSSLASRSKDTNIRDVAGRR